MNRVISLCGVTVMVFLLVTMFALPTYGRHKVVSENPLDRDGLVLVEIGAFSQNGKSSRCKAYVSPDSSLVRYIVIVPDHYVPDIGKRKAMFLEYTDHLIDSLNAVSAKYREWTKIARENYTGKFMKAIDVMVPLLGYDQGIEGSYTYTFTYPDLKEKEQNFFFNVWHETKDPSLLLCIDNYNDPDIPRQCRIAFKNCDEFDAFIEFLKYSNIQKRMKSSTINELFK